MVSNNEKELVIVSSLHEMTRHEHNKQHPAQQLCQGRARRSVKALVAVHVTRCRTPDGKIAGHNMHV